MKKSHFIVIVSIVFIFLPPFNGGLANFGGTPDGSETWGYIEVRPKAHMFWWYYKSPNRIRDSNNPWPVLLWLQGGPGASGVGNGNFDEVGPLDSSLKPRNFSWLEKGDLLFVDNPVGTGYSFVEDKELLVKTDEEAAADLTTLLIEIFNRNEKLQKSPLYIMAESYAGKFGVTLGLSALKAIEDNKLNLILGGIALGDSWISPEDFLASWGPLLKDVSRIDENGLLEANGLVEKIKQQIAKGNFKDAMEAYSDLEGVIDRDSNSVNFYNFLLDSETSGNSMRKYSSYLDSLKTSPSEDGDDLALLMNGVIRKKLGIIPNNVKWRKFSDVVKRALEGDILRPRIKEVDELLKKGVNVTIYNGQLDLICATKGAQAWVEKLKWEGLKTFLKTERTPLYCGDNKVTKGFTKSYKNLHFYWILGAGHFSPVDQPCVTFEMLESITRSSVSTQGIKTI